MSLLYIAIRSAYAGVHIFKFPEIKAGFLVYILGKCKMTVAISHCKDTKRPNYVVGIYNSSDN